jgi:anti-sigma-K factor RskA
MSEIIEAIGKLKAERAAAVERITQIDQQLAEIIEAIGERITQIDQQLAEIAGVLPRRRRAKSEQPTKAAKPRKVKANTVEVQP